MADTKLSSLSGIQIPITGTDKLYVARNGFSYQVSADALRAMYPVVQTVNTYLVTQNDTLKMLSMTGTQTQNVIFPSGVGFETGTRIIVERFGTGAVNIGVTGGVIFQSLSGMSGIQGQFGRVDVILRNLTTWVGAGNLT